MINSSRATEKSEVRVAHGHGDVGDRRWSVATDHREGAEEVALGRGRSLPPGPIAAVIDLSPSCSQTDSRHRSCRQDSSERCPRRACRLAAGLAGRGRWGVQPDPAVAVLVVTRPGGVGVGGSPGRISAGQRRWLQQPATVKTHICGTKSASCWVSVAWVSSSSRGESSPDVVVRKIALPTLVVAARPPPIAG